MPKLLDPDCTFKVVLKSDKEKHPDRAFRFRALSAREFVSLAEVYETTADSDSQAIKKTCNAVRVGLVGWENMGDREYNPEELDDLVTLGEATELLKEMLEGQQLTVDEAKN